MRTEPVALADFEGTWTLTRDILHRDGTSARFEGTALWQPAPKGLAYHEAGLLYIGSAPPMTAERRYLWTPALDVYFDDGRFFHSVPGQGGPTAHWCDPDQYDVRYDFDLWPRFSVIWRVSGPRKDYEMTSYFFRHDG